MPQAQPDSKAFEADEDAYVLDEQVGFILRQVQQRHAVLFSERFTNELTPTQWAAVSKLAEIGEASQNLLGRLSAMDVSTIKGVVNRLTARSLIATRPDPEDRRRVLISLSEEGRQLFNTHLKDAIEASRDTLRPLRPHERSAFVRMLKKLR